MTDLKISQFSDGGVIQDTDSIAGVRAGVNTKVTVGSMAAEDAADYVPVGSLGTAAAANLGTASAEVPTNNDLGDLAFEDTVAIATEVTGLGTGIATFLATPSSANLRAAVTDESGTGALVFAGGDIGAATATTAAVSDDDTSVATTAFVKDWTSTLTSYTPTVKGHINSLDYTNITATAEWYRVGGIMMIDFSLAFTGLPATGSGFFIIGIPAGTTVDTSKLPGSSSAAYNTRGVAKFYDFSTDTVYIGTANYYITAPGPGIFVYFAGVSSGQSPTFPVAPASGDNTSGTLSLPCSTFP